jgi:hypothetical protein
MDPNAPPVRGKFKGFICRECFDVLEAEHEATMEAEAERRSDRVRAAIGSEGLKRLKTLAVEIGDAIGPLALTEADLKHVVERVAAAVSDAAFERRGQRISSLQEPKQSKA